MQQIHKLQPPGRFLIEDETGDHCISSNNGSSQSDNAVHPLLLKKAWVQVENDKTLVKILHRLREKDKEDKVKNERCTNKTNSWRLNESQRVY